MICAHDISVWLDLLRINCTYLMAPFINVDMTAMPRPLPLTMNISTSSRRLLKYCATISVEQSLVKPTPTPTTVPEIEVTKLKMLNQNSFQDF